MQLGTLVATRAWETLAENFGLFLEAALDGIIIVDQLGQIVLANPQSCLLFGYTQDEILGNAIEMLVPDRFRAQHENDRTGFSAHPKVRYFNAAQELFGLRKDGTEFPVEISLSPLATTGGTFVISTVRDITERQRVAAALLKSEEQYRTLFEANPNPMWVFDLESLRFLTVNRAAVANYGYSKQEYMDMTISDVPLASELDHLAAAFAENDQGRMASFQHKRKDGSMLDVEITSHLMTFEGRPARLVAIHDVTERKSMETQLRQAQKMEAIGQLASGVAHDFNNLLGIIMGCTELSLLRLEEGSPITQKLLDVKSAALRAAGLTRQLLLFSRQEISEPRKVDLNAAVTVSERFLRRVIHENVGIECVLSKDRPMVTIDPGHLEQVLMNLVLNARDAMQNGGNIRIETALADLTSASLDPGFQPPAGLYALLTVSDTGTGMDAATKARVFEPFFTTKEPGKGTGLGLATVHGIIKQAGGHVTVYSELGRGTIFKIFLPLSSSSAAHMETADTYEALGGNETILLVEDEPALRSTVRDFLKEYGYTVLEGGNGLEALAVVKQHQGAIALLLTDVIMPGISGTELLDRLLIEYPDLQAVLMTGYTDDVLIRQGAIRPVGVIQKPFAGHALLQKIHAALSARKVDSKKHTILVEADDPKYKELMADMLRSAGFEVLYAEDKPRPFDLAILDLHRPRQKGLTVCKQLRSDPATARIPIVAVSGTTGNDTQILAVDAGANAFLRRPITRDELLAVVNTLLAKSKASSEKK